MLLVIAFAALIGLIIGSFLNVVILRVHAGRGFVSGRSACPHCGHVLSWYELFPVLSWIGLRGRCKACRKPISWQYPLVELLTATVFAVSAATAPLATYADLLILVLWLYVAASFIVLAVSDLRWFILPDRVLLPTIVPATAILIGRAAAAHSLAVLWKPLAAALVFGGAFYAIAAISKGKWMGGGDIKMAFVMGLLLGLQKTALAMLIAFDSAAVIGLLLILLRLRKRTDHIPFGPFLIVGTLVAFWFGSGIIAWYLRLNAI